MRQLDAVAARFLLALATLTRLLGGNEPNSGTTGTSGGYALLDVDDTIIEVHGHQKQGVGFGYSRVRGLNAILATLMVTGRAPVIVAQRVRRGACGSPRGAARLIGDAVKQARRLLGADRPVLVRMDSAFFGGPAVRAVLAGGADVSVTVRLTAAIKTAISGIEQAAWTTIEYTDAIRDETTGAWISRAKGRRDRLHRVRRAEDGAPGPGPARRAPHPRPQRRPEQGRRPRRPIRCVALPRVLHHRQRRRARHRRRRPDPPAPRDHRTGPAAQRPTSKAPRWRTCPPGS